MAGTPGTGLGYRVASGLVNALGHAAGYATRDPGLVWWAQPGNGTAASSRSIDRAVSPTSVESPSALVVFPAHL
jgi:hypothetical protein